MHHPTPPKISLYSSTDAHYTTLTPTTPVTPKRYPHISDETLVNGDLLRGANVEDPEPNHTTFMSVPEYINELTGSASLHPLLRLEAWVMYVYTQVATDLKARDLRRDICVNMPDTTVLRRLVIIDQPGFPLVTDMALHHCSIDSSRAFAEDGDYNDLEWIRVSLQKNAAVSWKRAQRVWRDAYISNIPGLLRLLNECPDPESCLRAVAPTNLCSMMSTTLCTDVGVQLALGVAKLFEPAAADFVDKVDEVSNSLLHAIWCLYVQQDSIASDVDERRQRVHQLLLPERGLIRPMLVWAAAFAGQQLLIATNPEAALERLRSDLVAMTLAVVEDVTEGPDHTDADALLAAQEPLESRLLHRQRELNRLYVKPFVIFALCLHLLCSRCHIASFCEMHAHSPPQLIWSESVDPCPPLTARVIDPQARKTLRLLWERRSKRCCRRVQPLPCQCTHTYIFPSMRFKHQPFRFSGKFAFLAPSPTDPINSSLQTAIMWLASSQYPPPSDWPEALQALSKLLHHREATHDLEEMGQWPIFQGGSVLGSDDATAEEGASLLLPANKREQVKLARSLLDPQCIVPLPLSWQIALLTKLEVPWLESTDEMMRLVGRADWVALVFERGIRALTRDTDIWPSWPQEAHKVRAKVRALFKHLHGVSDLSRKTNPMALLRKKREEEQKEAENRNLSDVFKKLGVVHPAILRFYNSKIGNSALATSTFGHDELDEYVLSCPPCPLSYCLTGAALPLVRISATLFIVNCIRPLPCAVCGCIRTKSPNSRLTQPSVQLACATTGTRIPSRRSLTWLATALFATTPPRFLFSSVTSRTRCTSCRCTPTWT
jgi:hypothetical protein